MQTLWSALRNPGDVAEYVVNGQVLATVTYVGPGQYQVNSESALQSHRDAVKWRLRAVLHDPNPNADIPSRKSWRPRL